MLNESECDDDSDCEGQSNKRPLIEVLEKQMRQGLDRSQLAKFTQEIQTLAKWLTEKEDDRSVFSKVDNKDAEYLLDREKATSLYPHI